eukprot:213671_1
MNALAVRYRQMVLQYNIITNDWIDDNIGNKFGYYPQSEYDKLKKQIDFERHHKSTNELLLELKQTCSKILSSSIICLNGEQYKRANWIKAQAKAVMGHINNILNPNKKQLSFDEESEMFYDIIVSKDYLNQSIINKLLSKLDSLLPKNNTNTLFERYTLFRNDFIIDDNLYEIVFDKMLKDAQKITFDFTQTVEFTGDIIHTEYYTNPHDPSETYSSYHSNLHTVMRMNKSRKITFEQCQQLTAHQSTHHIQFCLLDDICRKYPEFQCGLSLSPIDFLLEGGAELAVDLIFPKKVRIKKLQKILNMFNKNHLCDRIELLLDIDQIMNELWRLYTVIARDMINGNISLIKASELMENMGMKSRESWPNVDFYKQYKSYVVGYGFGKSIIKRYLERKSKVKFDTINENDANRRKLWNEFEEFFKFPLTPAQILQSIQTKSKL